MLKGMSGQYLNMFPGIPDIFPIFPPSPPPPPKYREKNYKYPKPTDKHQYLLHSSCHPVHTKYAIPFSLALRLRRICTNNETFIVRTNELIDYLYKRVYKRYFLHGKYTELTISKGQKHLRPMTLPHWTN